MTAETPIFDEVAAGDAERVEELLAYIELPHDPRELVYALGNTGECRPCHESRCEDCTDDGRKGSGACECARSTHGPNGRGVV